MKRLDASLIDTHMAVLKAPDDPSQALSWPVVPALVRVAGLEVAQVLVSQPINRLQVNMNERLHAETRSSTPRLLTATFDLSPWRAQWLQNEPSVPVTFR